MILHLSSKVVYNGGIYEFLGVKICLFRAKDVTLRHKIKSIHTTRVSVSIEGGSFQHFMEGSVVVFTWLVFLDRLPPSPTPPDVASVLSVSGVI